MNGRTGIVTVVQPAGTAARSSYPPRRILVPVDLGDASARALSAAAALASRYGAQVTALHADILEAPIYFTHEQAAGVERGRQTATAAVTRQLRRFVRAVTVHPVGIQFLDETPATAIVDASRDADLVVMGTHGRRGPSRWWLGSVAERVVRESTVPVLVVRASGGATAGEDGAKAIFMRPLMVAGPWTPDGDAERYVSGLAEMFGGTVADRMASCEADLVREREASLLVIVRAPASGSSWFGTPAERLIRSCNLPMLFVPDGQQVTGK